MNARPIALLGNFPPRRCGIATFTKDLHDALTSDSHCVDVYAMDDGEVSYDRLVENVWPLTEADPAAYRQAAQRMNTKNSALLIQHEYGIFGGQNGNMIFELLDRLRIPVVVTLHTILERPDVAQKKTMDRLCARADKIVVMSRYGRVLMRMVHKVPSEKIEVIPHGTPSRPWISPQLARKRSGHPERPTILTFGLISPSKGIETMIEAMPSIIAKTPDVQYVILGATHPHLVRESGEAYRDRLKDRVSELNISDNVEFIDQFVELETLCDHIQQCDVYVTPYGQKEQITSGTLSYAAGLGRPIISTPYWHAEELLSPWPDLLVPFHDAEGFATQVSKFIENPAVAANLGKSIYSANEKNHWWSIGRIYHDVIDAVTNTRCVSRPTRKDFQDYPVLQVQNSQSVLESLRLRMP